MSSGEDDEEEEEGGAGVRRYAGSNTEISSMCFVRQP